MYKRLSSDSLNTKKERPIQLPWGVSFLPRGGAIDTFRLAFRFRAGALDFNRRIKVQSVVFKKVCPSPDRPNVPAEKMKGS